MAKTRPFIVFFLFFSSSGLVLAQEQPDEGPQPSQPTNQQPQQQETGQKMPETERPIYLSGKVIYDDGAPADTSVQVELACNGRVRR